MTDSYPVMQTTQLFFLKYSYFESQRERERERERIKLYVWIKLPEFVHLSLYKQWSCDFYFKINEINIV